MKRFKVFPDNGLYQAPFIYVEADSHANAEKEAREKSGLGRFEQWQFIVSEV